MQDKPTKGSFNKAREGLRAQKLNRKAVIIILGSCAAVLVALTMVIDLTSKKVVESKAQVPVTQMVPSTLRYTELFRGETYEKGTDFIIISQSDGTRVKVTADGQAYYVDSQGNRLSGEVDTDSAISKALEIAKGDVGASVALAGLAEKQQLTAEQAQAIAKGEVLDKLDAAAAQAGLTGDQLRGMLSDIGTSSDAAIGQVMSGRDAADVVAQVVAEHQQLQQQQQQDKKETVKEEAPSLTQTILAGAKEVTGTEDEIEYPSWLESPDMSVPETLLASLSGLGGSGVTTSYDSQNQQAAKSAWREQQAASAEGAAVRRLSQWDLDAGTVIPVTLVNGINTDSPGDIWGTIRQDVYDTLTGTRVLIPKGTRVYGTYNSAVTFGQKRVAIAWTRMTLPSGYVYSLPGFLGVDGQGYSGYRDKSSNHIWSLIGGAILGSLLDIGSSTVSDLASSMTGTSTVIDAAATLTGTAATAAQTVGQKYVGKLTDRQPTITIRPGAQVTMLVTDILSLRR